MKTQAKTGRHDFQTSDKRLVTRMDKEFSDLREKATQVVKGPKT